MPASSSGATPQSFTLKAVSSRVDDHEFESNGETVKVKVFHLKVEGQEGPIRLYRALKTPAPKVGDVIVGEIIRDKEGPRLKARSKSGNRGSGGGGRARTVEDPRNARAGMAVKTAYGEIFGRVFAHDGSRDEELFARVQKHAKFLYDLATSLVGE